MRKFIVLCVFALLASTSSAFADIPKIGVVQITDLKQYNEAVDGFRDEMRLLGYQKDVNYKLIHRTVLGDTRGLWNNLKLLGGLRSFVHEFIRGKVDVIVTVGTPATVRSEGMIKDSGIPQIFAAVADPLAAGCPSMTRCLPNLTGATIYIDPRKGLAVARKIIPDVKKIGLTYSTDENAVAFKDRLVEAAQQMGIQVVAVQVSSNSDARPATEKIINSHVDAFIAIPDVWLGRDNFVNMYTLLDSIAFVKLPVIAMVDGGAGLGALISFGPSFRQSGREAAHYVDKILKKQLTRLDTVNVYHQEHLPYDINVKVMGREKIQIPYEILKFAKRVGQ